MIEMFPSGEHVLPSDEERALRDHLASCHLCLSTAVDTEEWDERLRAIMTNVSVPDGLRERLLSQLTQSAPHTAASATAPQTPLRSIRRVTSWLTVSIALIAGAVFWLGQPPRLQLATLENTAVQELRNHPDAGLPAFDHSFAAVIADTKWQKVCKTPPFGLNLDQRSGHDLAAFRVNIPSLRFRGWLVLIPISRISDIPTSTYPDTVHYAQTAAWNDGKYVFICLAEQGSIETLVAQWNSSAA